MESKEEKSASRKTEKETGGEGTAQAEAKLRELLHCGNERVELSAAKEILSMAEAEAEQRVREEKAEPKLEVIIRVLEPEKEK